MGENRRTVVFFLKKTACTVQRAPLFTAISDAAERNVSHIAVLPDEIEEARKYLRYLELPLRVHLASLAQVNVPAVPAFALVGDDGIVGRSWIGPAPNREPEMRDQFIQLLESNAGPTH